MSLLTPDLADNILYVYVLQYFTEKGHEHMSVSSHTVSFWTWVNMINASGQTFYNHLYDPNVYPG